MMLVFLCSEDCVVLLQSVYISAKAALCLLKSGDFVNAPGMASALKFCM